MSKSGYKEVVVHPLVLLSVVDHYNRVAKDTKKRVVGILLGERFQGKIDVTNSYAVPFEEDPKAPNIWYLDHNYHEEMYGMFKKVNAKEKVVGWYSTGPKIRPADLQIHELLRRYTSEPVLCIIDVNPQDSLEIPVKSYVSLENAPEKKSKATRSFHYISSEVGAYEAEEVGVEHLLRNIRDTTTSTVADEVNRRLASLKGLKKRMEEMSGYLDNVTSGKMPPNNQIIYNMQDMFNLRPDLKHAELVQAFAMKQNDNMLVVYLSSLIRSIIALHNLINNKLKNSGWDKEQLEREEAAEKVAFDKKKLEDDKKAAKKKDDEEAAKKKRLNKGKI